MTNKLRIALAQMNFMVGDIAFNTANVITIAQQTEADLIIFPELTLCAYPPEDLLLREELFQQIEAGLQQICQQTSHISLIVGYPQKEQDAIYNVASLIENGRITATYRKQCLPNYSVFDEKRYFKAGSDAMVFTFNGIHIGVTICEDLWFPEVAKQTKDKGAELIVSLNASPFHSGKDHQRQAILQQRVKEQGLPIFYCHWVGGQDEFIFDGGSMVLDSDGKLCAHAGFFDTKTLTVNVTKTDEINIEQQPIAPMPSELSMIYQALVTGVRDYVRKNKASRALVGLSGGIDSALTICLAVDALGSEQVEAVLMPSPYTAQMSIDDAYEIAENLNITANLIQIDPLFTAFNHALAPRFEHYQADLTEENLQARIRGTLLMAIANKTGALVLTTGNKSETAVGYSTLYGDTAGAFAVLKDVPKTLVYRLVNWRNQTNAVIPQRVITRPPSAELAPDQIDQNSLPPYDILDKIIECYVECDQSQADIVAQGFDADVVAKVCRLIDRNEYKRRQCPPGIRISQKAFGRDRRYPITSGFNSRLDQKDIS